MVFKVFIFMSWFLSLTLTATAGFVLIGFIENRENGSKTYPLKTGIAFSVWVTATVGVLYAMNRFYGV